MSNIKFSKAFLPVILFFLIINSAFLIFRSRFELWEVDTDVLVIGNLVLFLATALSFVFYQKSIGTKNPHAIVRMMYAALLSKMFICIAGVLIYVSVGPKPVNKLAIFGCFFLYVVYSVLEVAALTRLNKQKKNA